MGKNHANPLDAKQKASAIHAALQARYGKVACPLAYRQPHELVIAVMLSAQCTDTRVNQVTPALFRRFPDIAAFAEAPADTLEELIRPTGFFRNKARNIRAMAQALLTRHGGVVPATLEELVALPGIGRKTANVVTAELYGQAEGITVDTHVLRLARRWGLSTARDAKQMERDLMSLLPGDDWRDFSLPVILFGREICQARKPACAQCPISRLCADFQHRLGRAK